MPLVKVQRRSPNFTWYPPAPQRHQLPPPTLDQLTDAAFELENPVRAAMDLFTRQHRFEPEDNFDPASWLKENDLWEERENFVEVRSSAEAKAIAGRLRKRERAMRTLSAAGPVQAFALATTAGILSPTSLLPLTAGGKGVRALMQGAAYGALAGGIDEGILGMAQEGRTTGEMVMGVAATTVLGAGLGGAGAALTKRAQRRALYDLTRMADEIDAEAAGVYLRGSDDVTRALRPGKGVFRFARSAEIPDAPGPVRLRSEPEGSVAGPTYELRTDNALIITPDTLPLIRQSFKGDLTEENLLKFAEDAGHDAVAFEGFQDGPSDAVARYEGREQVPFRDLTPEDRSLLLDTIEEGDEVLPDDELISVRELEEVRPRELDVEEQVVVFDREKIRSVPDDDPVMQLPRLGRGFEDVPTGLISGIPAGAATVRPRGAGRLAAGAGNVLSRISPLLRPIQSSSRVAQWAAAQIDTAGMELELNARGIPSSPGGPIVARTKTWYAGYWQAVTAQDEAYRKYFYSGGPQPFASQQRAVIGGALRQGGKISYPEFRREVARAMRLEDAHEIPEVMEAAAAWRKHVFDPGFDEMNRAQIIPDEPDLKGDLSYLTRLYNKPMIRAEFQTFVELLQRNYMDQMVERYQKAIQSLRGTEERAGQLIEDLALSTEDLQRVRADLELEIHDLRKDPLLLEPEEVEVSPTPHQLATEFGEPIGQAIEGSVGSLRQSLRDLFNLLKKPEVDPKQVAKRLDEVRKAERRARTAQERTGEPIPDLAQVYRLQDRVDEMARLREAEAMAPEAREAARARGREQLKKARKRLSNLNKHRAVFEERQAAKLRKIERAEELNLKGLRTLIKKGRKALDEIDNLSDEARAKRVSELRTTFAQVAEQFDRAEERIARASDPELVEAEGTAVSRAAKLAKGRVIPIKNLVREGDQASSPFLLSDGRAITTYGDHLDFADELGFSNTRDAMREARLVRFQYGDTSEGRRVLGISLLPGQQLTEAQVNTLKRLGTAKSKGQVEPTRVIVSFNDPEVPTPPKDQGYVEGTVNEILDVIEQRSQGARVPQAQLQRADKLTRIAEELENADTLSAADLRALIREGLEEAITKTNDANSRRALRQQKLREQAEKLSPERAAEVRTRAEERLTQRRLSVRERFRALGAEDVDTDRATADFSQVARERATAAANKILGSRVRLAGFDIIQGERGAELARALNIPSHVIERFLENDIELLARHYLRTVAPDVEMVKKFGNVNGAHMFADLRNEKAIRQQEIAARGDIGQEQKNSLTEELNREYDAIERDLGALIMRVRHQWAIPEDPENWGFRALRTVMNLNVLRYMGGVTIASIPDVARPIMRQGFLRTFRDGFVPLITNFKQFQMSAREAKYAGVALDPILHTRAAALTDVMDDIRPGSKLERGTEWLTRRMGVLALFDFWTAGMKQFTAGVINLRILDSVDLMVNGGKATDVAEATRFLNSVGLNEPRVRRIWEEMQREGAGRVNGVWVPQTEKWVDKEAVRDFHQAIAGEIDNTIITPGVDAPLHANKNIAFKALFQFKSFMIASTSRTLMAGLQRPDASFISGVTASLALGALSYYLWAKATGGESEREMMEASPEKWVDEAIDRSGLLGAIGLGREFAQNVPGLGRASQAFPPLGLLSSFSGQRTTRRGGHTLTEAALGPSMDFAQTLAQVINQIDDPTQSTLHSVRRLAPWQNIFYLRQLFDFIEEGIGSELPERRDARSRRQATPAPSRP